MNMHERNAHETGPCLEPVRLLIHGQLARLPWWLAEFILFGLKQAWACLFAAIMLGLMISTKFIWQPGWLIHRYDFLLFAALTIQVLFLRFKLESWDEAKVILVYHVTGTVMEIFKVHIGSWAYPEPSIFQIAGVPLFSGFLYAAVGSFIARTIRIFDMRFTHYPPMWLTGALAIAIYANFFSHHYLTDIRYGLFAATVIIFWRVNIHFTTDRTTLYMPLTVAAFPIGSISVARREYRHRHGHMDLSIAEGVAHGVLRQTGLMVPAALCQFRAGDAGAEATPARSTEHPRCFGGNFRLMASGYSAASRDVRSGFVACCCRHNSPRVWPPQTCCNRR